MDSAYILYDEQQLLKKIRLGYVVQFIGNSKHFVRTTIHSSIVRTAWFKLSENMTLFSEGDELFVYC